MTNANRTALARTWRPRRFAEMATQEHVSETLRAAVQRGRTAHAYLFCGPRGVGKTTAARVLAMALNCPNRGSDGEPCAECESCTKIWSGKTSLDVIEIDAASNRGVDDARDLRERAMYAPTDEHRYKVYIIDEAHMLTREAWNALLKILEEPPPRVIFVFATTEPQKIQQTAAPILSRCQRFDFRRITTQGIVARLGTVLAGEGIEADDDALTAIARRAEGGMRDALSLTDQVLSFAGDRVSAEDVRRVLGLVGEEMYLELFDILAGRRYADVFHFVQRIIDEGYDLTEFYRGLADALRAIMVTKLEGVEHADVREDLRDDYTAVAGRFGHGDLLRMLSMVAELDTEGRFRKSANPRTMLESLLLRWAFMEQTVELETLLRAAGGDTAAAPEPRGAPGGTDRAPLGARAAEPNRPTTARSILSDLAPAAEAKPAGIALARQGPARDDSARDAPGRDAPGTERPPREAPPAERAPREAPPAERPPREAPPAERAPREAPPAREPEPPPAEQPPPPAEQQPPPADDPLPPAAVVADSGNPGRDAERALQLMLEQRRAPHGLGLFLRAAHVAEADRDNVLLELPSGPGLEKLTGDSPARRTVQDTLGELLGRPIALSVRSAVAGPDSGDAFLPPQRGADAGASAADSGPGAPPTRSRGQRQAPSRITPERVKAEKLARLARADPTLGEAIRDWDLELMD